MERNGELVGKGQVRRGETTICTVSYTVHLNPANRQGTVVEFETKPPAEDGDLVHLTLEDGRVLNCQIVDDSPYCAVVGDGPIVERRARIRC